MRCAGSSGGMRRRISSTSSSINAGRAAMSHDLSGWVLLEDMMAGRPAAGHEISWPGSEERLGSVPDFEAGAARTIYMESKT
jgi:hypothetical protein